MLASGAEGPLGVLGDHKCTGEARRSFSCILLFTAKFIDPGLVAVGLECRGQPFRDLGNQQRAPDDVLGMKIQGRGAPRHERSSRAI